MEIPRSNGADMEQRRADQLAPGRRTSCKYPKCQSYMRLIACNDRCDGVKWECRRQVDSKRNKAKKSLRAGSWFATSNLTLEEILNFTYWWSQDKDQIWHELAFAARRKRSALIYDKELQWTHPTTHARPKESLTKLPKGTATTSPTGISVETPTRPSPPLTRDTGPGTGTTGSDTPTRPPETEPGSAEASEPVSPAKPPSNPPLEKKIPLALRRLQDYNKKGLLEQ
ncbi:predicted protein [Nematostella vectensis]|uniref:Uncharacterized protein n=1 Tax=Nematostella vectensis TaxID=45351 RepID=A7SK66_NEMVE|nr:predicted protein [Nematostella vectensis]|eukprot:XP_001627951.1 predicted protein [Nematostella vectensis]